MKLSDLFVLSVMLLLSTSPVSAQEGDQKKSLNSSTPADFQFCVSFFLFAHSFTNYPNVVTEEGQCSPESLEDYNIGFRIGSIFIILITSALGKNESPHQRKHN
jgi:hypothetical protein